MAERAEVSTDSESPRDLHFGTCEAKLRRHEWLNRPDGSLTALLTWKTLGNRNRPLIALTNYVQLPVPDWYRFFEQHNWPVEWLVHSLSTWSVFRNCSDTCLNRTSHALRNTLSKENLFWRNHWNSCRDSTHPDLLQNLIRGNRLHFCLYLQWLSFTFQCTFLPCWSHFGFNGF